MSILIILALAGGGLFAAAALLVTCYRKVGPNEVLIVSGRTGRYADPVTGETHEKSFRIYHGGGTLVVPFKERVDVMSVELMTLEIRTPEFFTKFGVPIVVDGIAQIKVRSDDLGALATAAEMFLSKSEAEMNDIAHQMMQGHLRAVISTMPFEEIHASPEAFAEQVQRLTAADLANMGIQVVSFTIREVRDPSGFLQALGRPQLAEVQKNAELGEALAAKESTMGRAGAEREAKVSSAAAQREAKLAQIASEVAVADATAQKECRLHELGSRVAEAKASSDLAYDLSAAREQRRVMQEQLALRGLEIERREKELALEVERPAQAERRRIETLAEAQRVKRREEAEAEAEATRLTGLADAEVIRQRGAAEAEAARAMALAEAEGLSAKLHAEAEGMREKAEAWQRYSDAALGQLLIERLPEIASAVAAPLSKIDRIVLVGGESGSAGVEKVTGSVAKVMAQVPAVVEGLSGIDLSSLLARVAPSVAAPAEEIELEADDLEVLPAAE
jgi:flotillin